jgi:hypothetical protein
MSVVAGGHAVNREAMVTKFVASDDDQPPRSARAVETRSTFA